MRNSWSIIYSTKDYEALRAYFLDSVGELQGLESGPERGGIGNVIEPAMAQQVYKKNWSFYDMASWSIVEVLTVLIWRPFLKKFSLFLPGYKVHLQLLPMRFCGSFVFFSNAKRESFEFLVWNNQTIIRWNPCFWKDLHFL